MLTRLAQIMLFAHGVQCWWGGRQPFRRRRVRSPRSAGCGPRPEQDEPGHAIGMTHHIGDGHRSALRHPEQHETAKAGRFHDGLKIGDPP
jgi:hypothetical protein